MREADFWRMVEHGDGCWVWLGRTNSDGYGLVDLGDNKLGAAHRMAWIYTNGPIPEGLSVCHRCDNPPCCKPADLFLGTTADNLADMRAKGRGFALPPLKGAENPRSVVTTEMAEAILRDRENGLSDRELALRYGVSKGTIYYILHGQHWTSVSR